MLFRSVSQSRYRSPATPASYVYLYNESGALVWSSSTPTSYTYSIPSDLSPASRYIFLIKDDSGACVGSDFKTCSSSNVSSYYSFEVSDSPFYYPSADQVIVVNTTILVIIGLFFLVTHFLKKSW